MALLVYFVSHARWADGPVQQNLCAFPDLCILGAVLVQEVLENDAAKNLSNKTLFSLWK